MPVANPPDELALPRSNQSARPCLVAGQVLALGPSHPQAPLALPPEALPGTIDVPPVAREAEVVEIVISLATAVAKA